MWLDHPAGDPVHSPTHRARGANRRVLAGIAGLVLLWISVVVIGRVVAPESTVADEVVQDAPTVEAATPSAVVEDNAVLPTDDELIDSEVPDQHNFVTRRIAMNNVQVDRMKRQLVRRDSSPTIAYRSADGIAFVHLARGVAEVAAILDEGQVQAGHRILRIDGESISIDTTTLVAARVGDGASLVIADARDQATYFVGAEALAGIAAAVDASTDGATLSRFLSPAGHQLVPFDGLGLVAISKGPRSGTQIATPNSFEPLSEHRVLEANDTAMLEQVCESPLVCKLTVKNLDTGDQWEVPPSFARLGDTYHLAPDGLSLLRVTPEGFAEVYLAEDQSVSWVIGQGMRSPVWGSPSSYIVWLDLVGEPNLKIMFVDERDWLSIDLSALDAPLPVGPEFVIFEDGREQSDR